MGKRRDRHRYGPRGEYQGHTSDEGPLTKLFHLVLGSIFVIVVGAFLLRGCG